MRPMHTGHTPHTPHAQRPFTTAIYIFAFMQLNKIKSTHVLCNRINYVHKQLKTNQRKMDMKAIYVKYLAATNTKPTRMKACTNDGNSITVNVPFDLDSDKDRGSAVAYMLCDKMGWTGDLIGNGEVFVFTEEGVSKRIEQKA